MSIAVEGPELAAPDALPIHLGGKRTAAHAGATTAIVNPATGALLARVPDADGVDVEAAVAAAHRGFAVWRDVPALERGRILRAMGERLRRHGDELALIDARNAGGPIRDMQLDVRFAAEGLEFFGGLVTEIKGETIPIRPGVLNYTLRQPLGVVARIVAFNHPMMFAARCGAALAAGNAVIVKPAEQTPLSALRLAELFADLLPAGTYNVLTGGRTAAEALVRHPGVAKVALIGGIETGRAVLHGVADRIAPAALELGGKNALIACPDADPAAVAAGAVRGMNFGWAGQSCGSTSRVFLHDAIHDRALAAIVAACERIQPGLPEDPATEMGCLVSRRQYDRVLAHIADAKAAGARLATGGGPPSDARLAAGWFLRPTVFADVTPDMRLAREEVFGPVMAVLRWHDEAELLAQVNALPFGLACSVWTRDLAAAHRIAERVEAGYVWINGSSAHFTGAPFGGFKQSGLGREESIEELLAYTQVKNVNVTLA